VAWSSGAFASSTVAYEQYVPNGMQIPIGATLNCDICHVDSVLGTLNPFGQEVSNSKADAQGVPPEWALLRDGDADGDGQSNAQELGDPCGTWTQGQPAPRTTDISNPGDPNSTSPNPNAPACNGAAGDDDDGGCALAPSLLADPASWAALLVAAGLLWMLRRKPR
jgi:hypothetical protein